MSAIPLDYATDIGPVIDEEAQRPLDAHKLRMQRQGEAARRSGPARRRAGAGTYVTPAAYEIDKRRRAEGGGVRPHPARRALSAAAISTR